MTRGVVFRVAIHLLDNTARISNHHASCGGCARGHVFFVERGRFRPALTVEGVRRDFVAELAFIENILYEGIGLGFRFFPGVGPGFQQLFQDTRHDSFRVLCPATHFRPRLRFHRFRSGCFSYLLESVKFDIDVFLIGQVVVDIVSGAVFLTRLSNQGPL